MNEISLLKEMVEIYSPHGEEGDISQYLYQILKQLGFKAVRTNIGNVIGEIGEGKPVIFLCGHMDTVKGRLPVKLDHNKLYGRGVVDAKSPLAAIIMASSRFVNKRIKGKIIVAAVVDEEGHSKGMRDLIHSGIEADYAIFGEPSHLKYITVGYKGSLSLNLEIKTYGGHSSNPFVNNAIEYAMEIWKTIKKSFEKFLKKSLRSSITTQIVGIKNIGIGKTIIWVNFRYPQKEDLEIIRSELKNIISDFQSRNEVEIKLVEDEFCFPYYSDKKSELVNSLRNAIKEITNEAPGLITKNGTGDMNIFGNKYDIPTVTYGPGDPKLDHTEDEVIELNEYKKAIDILEKCIEGIMKTN
jgi:LysW-gamma-L-lysine carboxypeptidase